MPENGNRTTIWPSERVTGEQDNEQFWKAECSRNDRGSFVAALLKNGSFGGVADVSTPTRK